MTPAATVAGSVRESGSFVPNDRGHGLLAVALEVSVSYGLESDLAERRRHFHASRVLPNGLRAHRARLRRATMRQCARELRDRCRRLTSRRSRSPDGKARPGDWTSSSRELPPPDCVSYRRRHPLCGYVWAARSSALSLWMSWAALGCRSSARTRPRSSRGCAQPPRGARFPQTSRFRLDERQRQVHRKHGAPSGIRRAYAEAPSSAIDPRAPSSGFTSAEAPPTRPKPSGVVGTLDLVPTRSVEQRDVVVSDRPKQSASFAKARAGKRSDARFHRVLPREHRHLAAAPASRRFSASLRG